MGRPSAEALLISALLVNGDVTEASQYGIDHFHFRGYSQEYGWLQDYYKTYAVQPSTDAFMDRFPDFPYKNHEDIRYAADEVLRDYAHARITENVSEALAALRRGDITEATEYLKAYEYRPTTAQPSDLVTSLSFMDDYDATLSGLQVPWGTLQYATGGMLPGNFWVWAARLGQGKSAMLTHIAIHNLLAAKRVLYYSLEMNESELRSRIHAELATRLGYTGITAREIRNRTVDLYQYKTFVSELGDRLDGTLHTHTPADGPVSPSTVASRADEYDLVIVDYMTLMVTDSGQHASEDWRTATQISNRMKQTALATNTPVLVAAQINRDGETNSDLPPRVKNLAQADAIGQDADVVITHRTKPQGVATICSVEKNRHGPSGIKWWTKFDVNNGIFDEVSEEKAETLCYEEQERRESAR